jgi:DNA-directed RNA polymerase subunit M/transcription elongation factor TFIIS
MNCPKCKSLMAKRANVKESEVFKLGPDYTGARRAMEFYTEYVFTCGQCGHKEIQWHYTHEPDLVAK